MGHSVAMPETAQIVKFRIDPDLLVDLDKLRYAHGFSSRSGMIRLLIQRAVREAALPH